MSYVTIRRNAIKQITNLLAQAVAIEGSYYDDMDGTVYYTKTPEQILADLPRYDKIYATKKEDGTIEDVHFSLYRGNGITAWMDIESARARMNAAGFARVFPNDPQSLAYTAAITAKKEAAEKAKRDAAEQEEARLNAQAEPYSYAIGDRIYARFASLNKRSTAEEYRAECVKPEQEEGRKSCNWSRDLCEVEKVLELTPAEFGNLCNNLMESRTDIGNGGTNSDYELEGEKEFWQYGEDERKKFIAQSYHLVTVVTCPGCRPLVIDAQGYSYPRYVGLWPEPATPVNIPSNVVQFPLMRTVH